MIDRSEWHTPLAPISTTTSCGPGGLGCRSSMARVVASPTYTAAFMGRPPVWFDSVFDELDGRTRTPLHGQLDLRPQLLAGALDEHLGLVVLIHLEHFGRVVLAHRIALAQ